MANTTDQIMIPGWGRSECLGLQEWRAFMYTLKVNLEKWAEGSPRRALLANSEEVRLCPQCSGKLLEGFSKMAGDLTCIPNRPLCLLCGKWPVWGLRGGWEVIADILVRSDGRLDVKKMRRWREEDVFAIHFGGIVVRMCGGIGYGVGMWGRRGIKDKFWGFRLDRLVR